MDSNRIATQLDITKSRYSQDHFLGRLAHYYLLCNPLNLLLNDKQLTDARDLVASHRQYPEESAAIKESALWRAKYIFESSHHPELGHRMPLPVRMAAQIPIRVFLNGGMVAYRHSQSGVFLWHSLYQSWKTLVNFLYTSPAENVQFSGAFGAGFIATATACGTALALNVFCRNRGLAISRLVPFAAVALANATSLPVLHLDALLNGVVIYNRDEIPLAVSRRASAVGLVETVLSHLLIVGPPMLLAPSLSGQLKRQLKVGKRPMLTLPLELIVLVALTVLSTPMGFAAFNPYVHLELKNLEHDIQHNIKEKYGNTREVCFRRSFSGVRPY